jgi:hypothetical protein
MEHWDVIMRILEGGYQVNPLLQIPWVTTKICRADWLHVTDQGVTPDFIGNLFFECQSKLPGNSIKARVLALNTKTQAFYAANRVQDKIDVLLPSLFMQSKKGFKLRCSAAKARALVPFAAELATELLSPEVPAENALRLAATHLNELHATLSETCIFQTDLAREHSRKFALLYVSLHDFHHARDDRKFRIKPKLHLFMHITQDGSRPARHWNYRDEDWGGSVARLCRRRGGLLSCMAMSRNVLMRFVLGVPVPKIM